MQEDRSLRHLLPRYFLHGLLFSVVLFLLIFAWAFITVTLVFIGFFLGVYVGFVLGLIIGVVLLVFIFGGFNTYLMQEIWKVSVKTNWFGLFTHGLALFLILLLVSIPTIVVSRLAPNVVVYVVLFVVYCFVYGYVAKAVGGSWIGRADR